MDWPEKAISSWAVDYALPFISQVWSACEGKTFPYLFEAPSATPPKHLIYDCQAVYVPDNSFRHGLYLNPYTHTQPIWLSYN